MPQPDPEQPVPLTLQFTAVFCVPVTVALNCWVCPSVTFADAGEMLTPICSVMVTLALPDLVESAADVAVTVTNGGLGAEDGAVYRPVVLIVPHDEPMQPTPLSPHVTDVLLDPVTVAVNCCFAPAPTAGSLGETLTLMEPGDPIVTVAEPDTAPFMSEVAVTVTVFGLGAVPGAVYSPPEVMDPQVMPPQPEPDTLQMTMPLCGPLAENWTCPDGFTCEVAGEIVRVGVAAIVTVAVPDAEGSAAETARIVTVAGDGALEGAV